MGYRHAYLPFGSYAARSIFMLKSLSLPASCELRLRAQISKTKNHPRGMVFVLVTRTGIEPMLQP